MIFLLDDLSGVRFVSVCLKVFFIFKYFFDVVYVSSCLDLGVEVYLEVICVGFVFFFRRFLVCCSNLVRVIDV